MPSWQSGSQFLIPAPSCPRAGHLPACGIHSSPAGIQLAQHFVPSAANGTPAPLLLGRSWKHFACNNVGYKSPACHLQINSMLSLITVWFYFFSLLFPFQTKSEFTVEFSVSDSQGVSVNSHVVLWGRGAGGEGHCKSLGPKTQPQAPSGSKFPPEADTLLFLGSPQVIKGTVNIQVGDVNDNAPQFHNQPYSVRIPEVGSSLPASASSFRDSGVERGSTARSHTCVCSRKILGCRV